MLDIIYEGIDCCFIIQSILSQYSRLLEMTQKIAVRQDEPGIVKPMLGRPDLQNPPQRGRGHFVKGAILFLGAECM